MNTPNKTQQLMLDTVMLKLKYPAFRIKDPNLFHPAFLVSEDEQHNYGSRAYINYTYNPSALYKGEAYPRLTGRKRFKDNKWMSYLYIEISLPNMLFGNSIKELRDDNFEAVIGNLQNRFEKMGIQIFKEILKKAEVIKAHFGKNIPLEPPLTAQSVIAELYKTDMGKRKDIVKRHYENGGQALYFYATSSNIIFYDKKRDAAKSKGRAANKLRTKEDRLFLEEMGELLRFELRLTSQKSLNSFIGKATKQRVENITLEQIFSQKLCKSVLLKCWADIISNPVSQLALKIEDPPEEIFNLLIGSVNSKKKKAHSLNRVLINFGLYHLVHLLGARSVRNTIEMNWTSKTWQRLNKQLKKTADLLKEIPPSDSVMLIQKALESFERYNWQPRRVEN